MKNKFLLLLILGVTFFASCSDDDDDYSGTYKVDKLHLTLSGITQNAKEVELKGNELIMNNVIAGEASTTVSVVFDGSNFTGKNSNSNRDVEVNGSFEKGVMTLAVTLKMKADIVGTWNIEDQNITLDIEAPEGTKLKFLGNELSVENYKYAVAMMMGSVPQAYLKDVSFQENGFVVANYDANGEAGEQDDESVVWSQSPEGAVKWYVENGQVYLVPDLGMMTDSESRESNNLLESLLQNGLPLNYTINGSVLNVYVTKDQMLPFIPILSMLIESIEGDNLILGYMKMILPEMQETLNVCTLFNLGMNLRKTEVAEN